MQGRQYNQYKDPNTFYAPPHPERLKSALKFRPNLEIRVMFDKQTFTPKFSAPPHSAPLHHHFLIPVGTLSNMLSYLHTYLYLYGFVKSLKSSYKNLPPNFLIW